MADKMQEKGECGKKIRAVHQTMNLLGGKWKITIIAVLCYHESQRFSEILGNVEGISNRMLSKELKELEADQLILRTVQTTQPVTVMYRLTEAGQELYTAMQSLADWGAAYGTRTAK